MDCGSGVISAQDLSFSGGILPRLANRGPRVIICDGLLVTKPYTDHGTSNDASAMWACSSLPLSDPVEEGSDMIYFRSETKSREELCLQKFDHKIFTSNLNVDWAFRVHRPVTREGHLT